jgi:hypothetical protein
MSTELERRAWKIIKVLSIDGGRTLAFNNASPPNNRPQGLALELIEQK